MAGDVDANGEVEMNLVFDKFGLTIGIVYLHYCSLCALTPFLGAMQSIGSDFGQARPIKNRNITNLQPHHPFNFRITLS